MDVHASLKEVLERRYLIHAYVSNVIHFTKRVNTLDFKIIFTYKYNYLFEHIVLHI